MSRIGSNDGLGQQRTPSVRRFAAPVLLPASGLLPARWTSRLLLLAASLALCAMASAAKASSGSLEAAEEQAFRNAAQAVAKSVVRIQTVGGLDRVGEFLTGTAATTGGVVSDDGFIISSAFNFVAKPTSILIRLSDGRPMTARLVATDRLRMLTLLKIDAKGLVPLPAPSGQRVRPGQWVIVVGRTYDSADPSVSVGIVSAVNRVWGKAIQTDAKVSPVNYGGPLVDVAGNVLGVVVPLSPSGKEETAGVEWYDSGIGFAIPYEDVLSSVERLKKGKDLAPGLLGITFKEHGLDEPPAIDHVRFDSPAERGGLKSGDVVVEIEGQPIRRYDEVKMALGRKYAGEKAVVVVTRGQSKVRTEIVLAEALPPFEPGFLGVLPARLAMDSSRGSGVRFVFPRSPAEKAGIAAGDRILKWNEVDIADADQLASLVRRVRPGAQASALVSHAGVEKTVKITIVSDFEEVPRDVPPLASTPALPADNGPASKTAPTPATAPALPAPAAPGTATAPATPTNPAGKEADRKLKTGHFRDKLPGETAPAFWAFVPESYSDRQSWGLVIWFAPRADSMEAAMLSRWQGLCAERRLILVAPIAAEADGFTPSDLLAARQVVEHFLKSYRIDKNRIAVHGFSNSGPMASEFTFDNREQVRGLALASGLLSGSPPEGHPSYPLRFFFSTGEGDRASERIHRIAQVLRRLKFSVTVQSAAGRERSEYLSSDDVAELARWIDTLDRI